MENKISKIYCSFLLMLIGNSLMAQVDVRGGEIISIGAAYNQYPDQINSPCSNGMDFNVEMGFTIIKDRILLDYTGNGNIGLTTNNAWIANAFNTPIESFNKTGHGGYSIELLLYLMPVLFETNTCALAIGPGIGGGGMGFPSVDINNGASNFNYYNYNRSMPFGMIYSFKALFFLGHTFFFKAEYVNSFSASPISSTLNQDVINTVDYTNQYVSLGIGVRISNKDRKSVV